jgi:radical SAM superfamily enzyme with C-terminal helix-hairpin-helix motif
LDLNTYLTKIMVEAYVQQKTYIKMFGSYVVAVAFQSDFYL